MPKEYEGRKSENMSVFGRFLEVNLPRWEKEMRLSAEAKAE